MIKWNKKGKIAFISFIIFGLIMIIVIVKFVEAPTIEHTSSTDWTGTYNQTQTDGENITLSTLDVSTASYDSKSYSVADQDTNPWGFFFKSDGTKMYVVGYFNDMVHQYSLSTVWDVSTASYDNKNYSVLSQKTNPTGIFFKSDGTKMYVVGLNNDAVYQYSLSTVWDVSTASYDSKSYSVADQETSIIGIFFKSDGTKMYVVGYFNDMVHQYSLSTVWDVSTASYDNKNYSVLSQESFPTGVFFKSDGTKMYIIGDATDSVYQYSIEFFSSGTYTSQVIDTNYTSIWNSFDWTNTTDVGEIKFQIQSCDDASCSGETFIGPDNTINTYFTSNASLNTTLTPNNRYFQYKAFLETPNTNITPYLESVDINYSSKPNFEPIDSFSLDEDFNSFTIDLSDNVSDAEDSDSLLNFTWTNSNESVVTVEVINATEGTDYGYDCYQETANVSTSCGGLNTGEYSLGGNLSDEDWDTYDSQEVYINYTKPNGALSTSLWQVKDYINITNTTIDTNCFNQEKLILRVGSYLTSRIQWQCYNGSDWVNLRNVLSPDNPYWYEEATIWNISSPEINFTSFANITGSSDINITVWDTDGNQNSTNFTLTINAVNDAPWIQPLSDITMNEDNGTSTIYTSAELSNAFRDVENDQSPTSKAINSETNTSVTDCSIVTGTLSCTTLANMTGNSDVVIEMCDSGSSCATDTITLTVNVVNDPHWIDPYNATRLNFTTPLQDTVNQTINISENESIQFDIGIQDVETETHWYTWFVDSIIQQWDSTLNWFTYYFGYSSNREYNITVMVNDSDGQEVNLNWTIGVENIITASISGETYSPATIYNNQSATINATIDTGQIGIDTIWIEANYTGNYVNYSNATGFVNDGNIWSYYLDYGNFTNQENVSWTWYTNDTEGQEIDGVLQSFLVENRFPTVSNVVISPATPVNTDDLNCTYSSYNDDDSDTVTLYFQWYKAAVIQSIDLNSQNLSSGNITTGDNWQCGIIPYDGIGNGTEVKSQEVSIGSSNVAPTINNTNATTSNTNIISDSTNPTNNNSYVHFEVAFTDDEDAIDDSFLMWICNSTNINANGSCIDTTYCSNLTNSTSKQLSCEYTIQDETLQQYTYYAFVDDNDLTSGSSSGTFEVNHPPYNITSISPLNESKQNTQGVYLNFSGNDLDSDTITYRIYISNSTPPDYASIETTQDYWNYSASELTYYWFVESYDVHNYYGENSSINWFSVDYTIPNNTIEATQYSSTATGKTAVITMNQSDNTGLDSCYFKLSSTGDKGLPTSYTLTDCNIDINLDSTNLTDDNYVYEFFSLANDTYGNENESSIIFETSTYTAPSPGGGGGITKEYFSIGRTCTDDLECASGICDIFGKTKTKETCITSADLCGNGYCDERHGENRNNCESDCGPLVQLLETGRENIRIIVGGMMLFSVLIIFGNQIQRGVKEIPDFTKENYEKIKKEFK